MIDSERIAELEKQVNDLGLRVSSLEYQVSDLNYVTEYMGEDPNYYFEDEESVSIEEDPEWLGTIIKEEDCYEYDL